MSSGGSIGSVKEILFYDVDSWLMLFFITDRNEMIKLKGDIQ